MKREERYLVLKRKEIQKYLTMEQHFQISKICSDIRRGRLLENKSMGKNYVVVAEDWPMYEDTWKAIESWVDNNVD